MEHSSKQNYWLFSAPVDLSVFLGSAVLSLVLLAVGWRFGILNGESPSWTWVSAVLLIDVAHVWSTSFRVYFDAAEYKRRIWLYSLVPVFGYVVGVALYSEGDLVYWRTLAYLAVFHFVRQQFGWVQLYRAKLKETNSLTWWIDTFAIYLATIYPLCFWMTRLPRNFEWFVQNDFFSVPAFVEQFLFPVYLLVLAVYFGKTIYLYLRHGFLNVGKDIIVVTTVVCWYVGIVALDSDYAFTVTNVIIHGVPYFALIYFYAKSRRETASKFYRSISHNWLIFLATLWALAYLEELFWDKSVWHERAWLFGTNWNLDALKTYLVPLLALPQLTHYVLDGFVWKRKNNANFRLIG